MYSALAPKRPRAPCGVAPLLSRRVVLYLLSVSFRVGPRECLARLFTQKLSVSPDTALA